MGGKGKREGRANLGDRTFLFRGCAGLGRGYWGRHGGLESAYV